MDKLKFEKKIIAELPKCYSLAKLTYNNEEYIVAATEKEGDCLIVDKEGNIVDRVWSQPGGVMSIVPAPGTNGAFLATHRFYSPNDSADASIVFARPDGHGWETRTITKLPHVHRFDILQSEGRKYLIACTLKSGHQYKDDWSSPGKIYVAELPDDLYSLGCDNQLELRVIKDGLLKNHGFFRRSVNGVDSAVVSAEQGVFLISPPSGSISDWSVELLTDIPSSDAVLYDINQDGQEEIVLFESFHGSSLRVLEPSSTGYQEVFSIEHKLEFLHAIWADDIAGKPSVVIGHRKGKRELFTLSYDSENTEYKTQIIDENCGSANVLVFSDDKFQYVAGANRETDQLCFYKITR